jgi:hypothetical protein
MRTRRDSCNIQCTVALSSVTAGAAGRRRVLFVSSMFLLVMIFHHGIFSLLVVETFLWKLETVNEF